MSWQHRKRYPKNWEELARACKERAGWKCEECGVGHGSLQVERKPRGLLYFVSLAAAHIDHDPWNPDPRLKALCQDCHFQFDRWENGKSARLARCRNQRNAMKAAGQLDLFVGV